MIAARGVLRRFARDRRGASAVEFAIVVGPLLLMVLGTIEFGRAMWMRQAISEAAIAGARCMGIRQTECSANGLYDAAKTKTYVVAAAAGSSVSIVAADVTLNAATSCGGVAGFSKVTVSRQFETVAPALLTDLAGGETLTATACFPNQP